MTTTVSTRAARNLTPAVGRDFFQSLRDEMEDLFGRFFAEGNSDRAMEMRPTLDLSESDAAVHVRMDVPGMKAHDIDIEFSGNLLRIKGHRTEVKDEKVKMWHRVERQS
mgnify:FL=1